MFENENEEDWLTPDFKEQLAHFNQMYASKHYNYIDSEDIEYILDHLIMSNQLKKAKWAAEKSLEHFPANSIIMLRYSQILSMAGEMNAALKLLLELESVEPFDVEVQLALASCYSILKNNQLSIKYYKNAFHLATDDERIEIAIDLALEYENVKDYKTAINLLKKLIEDGNFNDLIVYELAHCYEKTNDFDNAIKCFLKYIDEEPYSYTTWYNLGNVYSNSGQFEQAVWAYEYAILINETFIPAIYNLANVYMDIDKPEKALQEYEKCTRLDRDDPMIYYSMGESYEDLGEFEKAYEMYDKSTKLIPQYTDAWIGKGVISDILGSYKRAIKELLIAVKLSPERGDCWQMLGRVYEKNEQLNLANESYEEAFKLTPNDQEVIIDYFSFLIDNSINKFFEIMESSPKLRDNIATKMIFCYYNWSIGNNTEAELIFEDLIKEDKKFAENIFTYFPEMNEDTYYVNRLSES